MKITALWVVLSVAAPMAVDAKPLATCKAMCQRLTDCKLSSYTKMCLDTCKQYGYEASEQGRAQLLVLTRYTCKQIQSALGATQHASPQPPSSPRSPSARPPSPRAPSASTPRDVDGDVDDDDDEPPVNRSDRGRGGGRTYDGRRAGNAGSSSGSGQWSCRAVGSYAPPGYDGSPDYSDTQNVDVTKWGRTRDEAGIAAIDACSGMLSLSANTAISPGSLITQSCRVLSCSR